MRLGIARRPRRRRPGLVFVQSTPLVPLSAENGVRCIRVALHCAARILFWLKMSILGAPSLSKRECVPAIASRRPNSSAFHVSDLIIATRPPALQPHIEENRHFYPHSSRPAGKTSSHAAQQIRPLPRLAAPSQSAAGAATGCGATWHPYDIARTASSTAAASSAARDP